MWSLLFKFNIAPRVVYDLTTCTITAHYYLLTETVYRIFCAIHCFAHNILEYNISTKNANTFDLLKLRRRGTHIIAARSWLDLMHACCGLMWPQMLIKLHTVSACRARPPRSKKNAQTPFRARQPISNGLMRNSCNTSYTNYALIYAKTWSVMCAVDAQ